MQTLIRVARAAFYNLFIDEVERHGAPAERWLEDAGMPMVMRDDPDCYVSSLPFLHFLIEAERRIGIDDMSGNAIRSLQTSKFSKRSQAGILGAASLYCAICSFVKSSRIENSEQHFWVDLTHPQYLRVRSSATLARNAYHPNFLQNWAIIRIVRDYVGNDWMPAEMAFESDLPPGEALYNDLHDTAFLFGQQSAWVSIPKSLLWLPPKVRATGEKNELLQEAFVPIQLPAALRELLKTELKSGRTISIDEVAEQSATSARTLQRTLAKNGFSFRSILSEAKAELAAELLKDPRNRVIDVAMTLGYNDASHFARSFRRVTGQTPSEYQNMLE